MSVIENSLRPIAILAVATSLAACARTETPEEARAAAAATQAAYDNSVRQAGDSALDDGNSPGQIDAGEVAVSPGRWTVAESAAGSVAQFTGENGDAPLVSLRCASGGGVELRRAGVTVGGSPVPVYVSLPEGESRFAATADPAAPGTALVAIPASDPFVDRLLDSPGPITVRASGTQRLSVPNAPELIGLVSTCGGPATPPVAAPAAAAPQQPAPATPPSGGER